LTLQQLEYFLAAYRHGSFSGAADELRLAQPSVSEQVRRLEAELGVALFARVGRGLAPTEAGETLRPHAERTLAEADAARESVVAVRELRGGIATFGTWGTARYYPGTDIVAEFRRRHPDVRVRLVGQNSTEVVDAVRVGELEAGMVALPIDDRGLDVEPVMRDEIVYASADPRRVRRAMTVAGLADAPLILADASYGADDPTRRHLNELAQREGVTIEPQIDVEDVEAALELAARGMGDTIVARGLLLALGRSVPRRLGWVPFDEPVYDQFAFIARRGARLSPASREFVRLARERLTTLAETLETRPPRRRRPGGG
jgi:DNA-binding transcriptional LysR family regulator